MLASRTAAVIQTAPALSTGYTYNPNQERRLTSPLLSRLFCTTAATATPPPPAAAAPFLSRLFGTTAATATPPPPAAAAPFDHEQFTEAFLSLVKDVPTATDPAQSSAILRRLVQSGVLQFTDMEDAPEKFFLAHRLLSTIGLGGFGVRFTVQFNLFAGSIIGLASTEQRAMLNEIQEQGQLGCFLLTEMQVGVVCQRLALFLKISFDFDFDFFLIFLFFAFFLFCFVLFCVG